MTYESLLATYAGSDDMTRTTTTRKDVLQEFRRTEILAAAAKVFGEKGYEATHMMDVAEAAGLAKGTLYLYFPSKDAIYEATLRAAVSELQILTEDHIGRETDFAGKLAAFVRVRIAFWSEKQSLYRVIVSLGREAHNQKRSIALQRKVVEYLTQLFRRASAAGEIPEQDFEAAAWATMDAIRGVNERRVYSEGNTTEHDTRFLTEFLLNAVGWRSVQGRPQ